MLDQDDDASELSESQYRQLLKLASKMEEDGDLEMECDSNIKLVEDRSDSLSYVDEILSANDEARPTKDGEGPDGYSEGRWSDEEHEKFLHGKSSLLKLSST
jgi:hypothetical protein